MQFQILIAILGLLVSQLGFAQDLNLPRKSPTASTTYTIGLTEVSVRYGSPAVRNRVLWGDLIPFNQVWRTGANEATRIAVSQDIWVEGQRLPAGEYAFFVIPREEGPWTAIFNRDTSQWGAYSYDEDQDALRVQVVVDDSLCMPEERLHFYLSDTGLDEGELCLRWERLQLCLSLQSPVLPHIDQQLQSVIAVAPPQEHWRLYAEVADFLSTYQAYLSRALAYALESTARYDNAWNWWVRAQLEAKLGDLTGASISAQRAISAGKANLDDPFYQSNQATMQRKLSEWQEGGSN